MAGLGKAGEAIRGVALRDDAWRGRARQGKVLRPTFTREAGFPHTKPIA